MDALLATSFMRRHSSIDTKLGHVNESIIMNNALMESEGNASLTIFKMDFACEVGLVSNLEQDYLHASPDYLMLISKDGNRDVAFAEIKCRTRVHTANLDRQLSNGVDKWIEVNAGSSTFKTYVRNIKERFQLIHQAATLQIQKGLLIIGDRDGNIIRGIWIHFDNDLIQNYCKCLEGIYKNNFTFTLNALEGTREASYYINVTTTKLIEEAIKKQEYVDMESFLYNFKYWVAMRRGSLPLSTSKRCIPTIASLWNRSKNGSDVATGIMRGSWYPLPTASRTPSALVVQRILFLTTINIMKIATFLTFKN